MDAEEAEQTDPLRAIFAEGLRVAVANLSEASSPSTHPEWDSLASMELVSLIEGAFTVRLTARDIMKMQTIGLARQVLRGKGVQGI
jgi:acyl carrier protein